MLLTIGYLMCAYLILKAIEIYVYVITNDPENKTEGRRLSMIIMIGCLLAATIFAGLLTYQARSSSSIPSAIFGGQLSEWK